MALALVGEKINRNRFTGEKIENSTFFNCDFSGADLSGTEFIGCQFYDRESQKGCNFSRAMLKDAIFKSCDLSMADFRNARVIPPFLGAFKSRGHAACARRCFGV